MICACRQGSSMWSNPLHQVTVIIINIDLQVFIMIMMIENIGNYINKSQMNFSHFCWLVELPVDYDKWLDHNLTIIVA